MSARAGGAPDLIVVGRLGGPHGLGGEMRLVPETDFPERLRPGRRVALCPDQGEPLWTKIRGVRPLKGSTLLLAAVGVDTPEAARRFLGGTLRVAAADLPPLPPGTYYHHQLVGLTVLAPDGAVVGRLTEVLPTGANDVYVVARPVGRPVLIPAIRDAVEAIDLAAGTVRLRPLAGLLDEG